MKRKIASSWLTGFVLAALIVVILVIVVHQQRVHAIELVIQRALERIPEVQTGMKQKDVYALLGLREWMGASINQHVEGRSGMTWSRFAIGSDGRFVLECESYINRESGEDIILDQGEIVSVSVREADKIEAGVQYYKILPPAWIEPQYKALLDKAEQMRVDRLKTQSTSETTDPFKQE